MKRPSLNSPELGEAAYRIGNLRLEPDGMLWRGGTAIHLPPKELAALRLLAAHAGHIVSPAEIKESLWGEVSVTAESVPRCLSSLRARLLPDDYIQTVYKRGYRLWATVQRVGLRTGAQIRLAIVPFACGFNVPEHLGPGVAEDTIARLTELSGGDLPVAVLARDSTFTLARQGLTAAEIGSALQADLVLTGTLRRLPAHYRLRLEMVDATSGEQLWVEDLLVELGNIALWEEELAARISDRLHAPGGLRSAPVPKQGAVSEDSSQAEARFLYLRARHEWQTLQRHRMQDGLQQLMRATELDPSLVSAQVELAKVCITQSFLGFMAPLVAGDHVRRAAAAVLAASDDGVAILPLLGWIRFHLDRDLRGAVNAFDSCASLPHDHSTTRVRSMLALSRGRFDEATAILSAALSVDPYSPWLNARLAWALHLAGRTQESLDQTEHTLSLFVDHDGAVLYGSMILAYQGQAERAERLAERLTQRTPYFDTAVAVHGYALAMAGRQKEARAILERLQWMSRERFVLNGFNAALCVALGDMDAAMNELRVADESRCPWFFQMLADPRLAPLGADPDFRRMKTELGAMEASLVQPVAARLTLESCREMLK